MAVETSYQQLAPHYDALMATVPYEAWADYLERIFSVAQKKPRTLLDLATGTGSVAFALAKRGYRVTGVDIARPMLEVARAKARRQGVRVRFVEQDITQLTLTQRFEAAVCLYDSLNYILDPADLRRGLERVHRVLKPEGIFIFDLNSVHSYEQELFTQEEMDPGTPVRYQWRSRYNPETRVATVRMEFWVDCTGEHFTEVHQQRAYSVLEVVQWLREAGFDVCGLYHAYSLHPPEATTERIFFLARHPV